MSIDHEALDLPDDGRDPEPLRTSRLRGFIQGCKAMETAIDSMTVEEARYLDILLRAISHDEGPDNRVDTIFNTVRAVQGTNFERLAMDYDFWIAAMDAVKNDTVIDLEGRF